MSSINNKLNMVSYTVRTVKGKLKNPDRQLTSFLSKDEIDEFNLIGYTGHNSSNERTNVEDYLNSLGKGLFNVNKLEYGKGDFTETLSITRVYEKTSKERLMQILNDYYGENRGGDYKEEIVDFIETRAEEIADVINDCWKEMP